ncbi:Endoglucanase [hydrothermal vent metagenome]|uniref:Endoglucanase n=1 Tax=hydrothermal vent metagenome TaxID=652676 RepID=A0A3B0T030_9ZZZZ
MESRYDRRFVTVSNGEIVDGHGAPLLLRGVGLGNWLLPEGYMWHLSPGRESAREIEDLFEELVGSTRAQLFWDRFRDTFITRSDVDAIAAEGFDHVRLPINWRVILDPDGCPLEAGLALIDRLIDWCADAGLWVLLDLHGAPGGQTGTNVDDSNGRPELFMNPDNKDLAIALWRMLAERYRDDTTVLGYDLLNEPLPNEWQTTYPEDLVDLYQRMTAAIREVDQNHLIMYEGTHWASNWDIFTEVWDPNSVLQFHRYWSPPDRSGIQRYVNIGVRLGLPIYMGEGGENNVEWLATAFQLYEDHAIGWNFWPWKKIDTITSPCSIDPPPGWSAITAYAKGEAKAPGAEESWATLEDLIDRMAFDSCTYRADVVNALFRRAPLSLGATGFGFKGQGVSYGTQSAEPLRAFRCDDSVTIEQAILSRREEPNFEHTDGRPRGQGEQLVVLLNRGEWVTYDIEAVRGTAWSISVTTTDGSGRSPIVSLDDRDLVDGVSDGSRFTVEAEDVKAGRHSVRITSPVDGLRLTTIDVRTPELSGNP